MPARLFFLPALSLLLCQCQYEGNPGISSKAAIPIANKEEKKPVSECSLDKALFEISGITDAGGDTVACVQDEKGTIFLVELATCRIVKEIDFGGPGDYEGITRVGNNMYILRSDGLLIKVSGYLEDNPEIAKIQLNLPAGDVEGLGYDVARNRLLVAPKAKFHDEQYAENFRPLYAFDLKSAQLMEGQAVEIKVEEAVDYLKSHGLDLKKKKSGKLDFNFNISGIASHPTNGTHYVALSDQHLILKVDGNGKILGHLPLSKKDFPQPEGITILDNQLVVSSEGKKSSAGRIAVFNL